MHSCRLSKAVQKDRNLAAELDANGPRDKKTQNIFITQFTAQTDKHGTNIYGVLV